MKFAAQTNPFRQRRRTPVSIGSEPQAPGLNSAFTLLEVMIALGIFFMAVFAILALVSSTLRNARGLQRGDVDAGMVAAQLFKTNRLTEGTDSGDFGDVYPDFSWQTEAFEADTNGLWQVNIIVRQRGNHNPVDEMQVWVYSPESKGSGLGIR